MSYQVIPEECKGQNEYIDCGECTKFSFQDPEVRCQATCLSTKTDCNLPVLAVVEDVTTRSANSGT